MQFIQLNATHFTENRRSKVCHTWTFNHEPSTSSCFSHKILLPCTTSAMKRTTSYTILLVGTFAWCSLVMLAPLAASEHSPISRFIYNIFFTLCHQYDSRSLHLFGYKLAVCARCFAIYTGFFVGVLGSPIISHKLRISALWIWLIAILPMFVDVALDTVGLHVSTTVTRLVTGGWFGIIAALILVPLFVQAFSSLHSTHVSQQPKLDYES
jgi:uncharacterized membrane protein